MSGLSSAADLLLLNLLTLLCCIPIITAGAAITALNDRCIHLVRQEGGSIVNGYFRAFKENFKKGTIFGLIVLAVSALLYFDFLAAQATIPAFRIGITAISILALAVAEYAFALLARYENTLWNTIKNAAVLSVAWFPRTLLMVMFTIGFWLTGIVFVRIATPVMLMFALSLPCYVCSMLMRGIFDSIEKGDFDEEQE